MISHISNYIKCWQYLMYSKMVALSLIKPTKRHRCCTIGRSRYTWHTMILWYVIQNHSVFGCESFSTVGIGLLAAIHQVGFALGALHQVLPTLEIGRGRRPVCHLSQDPSENTCFFLAHVFPWLWDLETRRGRENRRIDGFGSISVLDLQRLWTKTEHLAGNELNLRFSTQTK